MSQIPLVSVVVCAHNEERFIGRAVRSLENQNCDRSLYEIIVVDDGSTDGTAQILEIFGSDITVLRNDICLGLPASINRGIKAARGKYVVRMDGDDYVSADYLYILYKFLEENHEWDAVSCDYLLVDDDENVLIRVNAEHQPIGCGIMFRIKDLIEIGMYDEKFLMHEDQDLRIRFLQRHSIHRIALPMYRYRQHFGNMTKKQDVSDEYLRLLGQKHRSSGE